MDVILYEWFGVQLPTSKVPWEGPVYLPDGYRLLYCLERTYARQGKANITTKYLSRDRPPNANSVFGAYIDSLQIPDEITREREALQFIARQADHLTSLDDYVFIVKDLLHTK